MVIQLVNNSARCQNKELRAIIERDKCLGCE